MTGGWGLGIDFFEKIADIEALFLLCGLCVEKSPEENFVQRKILPTGTIAALAPPCRL